MRDAGGALGDSSLADTVESLHDDHKEIGECIAHEHNCLCLSVLWQDTLLLPCCLAGIAALHITTKDIC